MKRTLATVFLMIFGFAWCFGAGMFVYKYALWKPCQPATPVVPAEKLRTEYDVLITSEEYMLVLDFYKNSELFYGHAYLYNETDGWKKTEIAEGMVSVSEVDAENNFIYSISSDLTIEGKAVSIRVPEIYLPMLIRGEKTFGKFGGATPDYGDYLTIDGYPLESKAALLVGFNYEPADVSLDQAGVHTNWAMFFDEEDQFNHLDITEVDNVINGYKPHRFFGVQYDLTVTPFTDASVVNTESGVEIDVGDQLYTPLKLTLSDEIVRQHTDYKMYAITGDYTGVYLKINAR